MSEKVEEFVRRKQEETRIEIRNKTLIEFMFRKGFPLEQIVEETGLTEAQILQIKAKLDQRKC